MSILSLSFDIHSHNEFSPIFNAWLPKGEKRKMKGEKEVTSPLNLLEVTSAGGRGACNNGGKYNNSCLPLLHLCDQKQQLTIRTQIPAFEGQGPFTHPGFCKPCASCSRNTCTAACHVAWGGGWVAATVLRAQTD